MARLLVIGFSIMALVPACGGGGEGNGGGNGAATSSIIDALATDLHMVTHSYAGHFTDCTDCTERFGLELTGPTAGVYRYSLTAWIETAEATSIWNVDDVACQMNADLVWREIPGYTPDERVDTELTNFDDTCYSLLNIQVLTVALGATEADTNGDTHVWEWFYFDPETADDPHPEWDCAGGESHLLTVCASGDGTDPACGPLGRDDDPAVPCDLPAPIEN